jgi:predicted nucleic acid-binding protein
VNAAYIDASALVKLFKAERETDAFRTALADWPVQVASELIRVEAICTARRLGGEDVLQRANVALERLSLIPISQEIIELATGAHTPPLRAMDAIHLATALTMREDLGVVFVYDDDLHAAARAHQLNPLAPR